MNSLSTPSENPCPGPRKTARPTGAIDLSTLVWGGLVGLALYLGFMYLPPYMESYEVKQMLHEVANRAVHQPNDEVLKREILEKARSVGSHYEIRDGQERILPGIVLLDDDVAINRDESAKTIVIQIRYTKHLSYPFTQRQTELTFTPAVKADISEVKW